MKRLIPLALFVNLLTFLLTFLTLSITSGETKEVKKPLSWRISDMACLDWDEGSKAQIPPQFNILSAYQKVIGGKTYIRVDILNLLKSSEEDLDLEIVFKGRESSYILYGEDGTIFLLPQRKPVGRYEVNPELDYVEAEVSLGKLAGLKIFKISSFKNGVLMDTTPCTYPKLSPLKVAIVLHGNQPLINSQLFWERFWAPEEEAGLLQPLLIIEDLKVPFELHLSGFLLANLRWHAPDYLRLLRRLQREGLIDLERGTWSEELLPFLPKYLNEMSVTFNDRLMELSGLRSDHPICWVPERVIDGSTLELLRELGCQGVIIDFPSWWIRDYNLKSYRVVMLNGVALFPIDHLFQYDMFSLEDQGPTQRLREHLFKSFLQNRDDKLLIAMNDWEFAAGFPFGSLKPSGDIPKRFKRVLAWLKDKPWIEFTTPTRFLRERKRALKNYELSTEKLPLQSYLEVDQGIGALRSWMYGDRANEGYADYKPYLRGSWIPDDLRIKTPMGDFLGKRKGILSELLKELKEECLDHKGKKTPLRKSLCQLGELWIISDAYETGWHDWVMDPSLNKKRIALWERFFMADMRNAMMPLALIKLLEEERREGSFLEDVDMDGVSEGVMINENLIAVIEPVGGYVKLLMTRDGRIITGGYFNAPVSDGEALLNPQLRRYGTHHVRHRGMLIGDVNGKSLEESLYNLSPSSWRIYQLSVYGRRISAYEPKYEIMKEYELKGNRLEVTIRKIPTFSRRDPIEIYQPLSPRGVELALSPGFLSLLQAPYLLKWSVRENEMDLSSSNVRIIVKAKGCTLRKELSRDMPYQLRALCLFRNIYRTPVSLELIVR